jgi:hypothetical protein
MAAKPNKRRRELNRLQRERENRTEVRASSSDKRRPLVGFEQYYEITSTGNVWSKRLERYIKHKFEPFNKSTFILFHINGETHALSVWEAVAKSWLTPEQRAAILAVVPREQRISAAVLKASSNLINLIASEYGVGNRVIFGLLLQGDS